MKKLLLLCLLGSCFFTLQAQFNFVKTYGGINNDFGMSVQQTTDGGYILFGQTSSFGNGQQDMYLIKTDNQGNEQWSQTYGEATFEFGISAQQTSDGGYILCGAYSGLGNDTLALIKTDQSGNEVWNRRFSGSVNRDVGQFVQETSDGGFIAVGFTGVSFMEDIFIVKTDINGNLLWNKVHASLGREFAVGVRQTGDGGYIIVGETDAKGFGGKDLYLMKTNSLGDTTWTKTFGTSAQEIGRSIFITSDNGFILLGYEDSPGGNLYMIKTDALGTEQWSNYYGGVGWDLGYSVQQTSDGGYILGGRKENVSNGNHDMYCIKTNSTGAVQWEYTYPLGLMSDAISVQQTSDGGYVLFGTTTDTVGTIDSDMYLVKVNSLGVSVQIHKNSLVNVNAYPNPFTNYTTIKFDNIMNQNYSFILLNDQGQIVKRINNFSGRELIIKKENLTKGLYFFHIVVDEESIVTGKLVIQ